MFGFLKRWWAWIVAPPRWWRDITVAVSLRTRPRLPTTTPIRVNDRPLVTSLQKMLEIHDTLAAVFQQYRNDDAEVIGRKLWYCFQALHIQGYDADVHTARQLLREHQQGKSACQPPSPT